MEDRRTWQQRDALTGSRILDPDGFRRNPNRDGLYTRAEFDKRLAACTARYDPPVDPPVETTTTFWLNKMEQEQRRIARKDTLDEVIAAVYAMVPLDADIADWHLLASSVIETLIDLRDRHE